MLVMELEILDIQPKDSVNLEIVLILMINLLPMVALVI
jgi:hypothetical protein